MGEYTPTEGFTLDDLDAVLEAEKPPSTIVQIVADWKAVNAELGERLEAMIADDTVGHQTILRVLDAGGVTLSKSTLQSYRSDVLGIRIRK